jgi:hypothetical protein
VKLSLICEHSDATEGVHWCGLCSTEVLKGVAIWAGTMFLCVMIAAGQKR